MCPRKPLIALLTTLVVAATAAFAHAQDGSLTLLARDGHRTLAMTMIDGRQMVALDELAALFRLTVRDDSLAGGVTVTYGSNVIVLTAEQGLASVGGRLVSLPSPPTQRGGAWFVPLEFISRALASAVGMRLELRPASGLVIVGDLNVPRIDVQYASTGDQARVSFEMTPATPYSIDQEQGRLVVKFDADALDLTLPVSASGSLVTGIRAVDQPTWVAIDLGPAFASFRSSTLAASGGSSRLVVNVLSDEAPVTNVARTPEPAAPVPSSGAGRVTPPPALDLAPAPELRTIVIDAGHGGEDSGTRGPAGVEEKDITLQVARRLKDTIESRLGLRVVLTRDGNRTVRLDERAAIANNNKAELFISLHVNASASPTASGAEVYYLALDDYGDETGLADAEGRTVPVVGGGTRNIEVVLWEMAQVQHVAESTAFAAIVDAELRRRVTMSSRTLRQAPFRVLVGANMPAVLVEMGFMSNPAEERQLTSMAFQDSMVQALFQSVVAYRTQLRQRWSAEISRRGARPPAEARR